MRLFLHQQVDPTGDNTRMRTLSIPDVPGFLSAVSPQTVLSAHMLAKPLDLSSMARFHTSDVVLVCIRVCSASSNVRCSSYSALSFISRHCGCPGLPEGPPGPSGSVGGEHGPPSRLRNSRWASPLARINSLISRLITTLYEPVTPSCCPPVYGLLESLGNNSLARVTSLARCRLVDQVCTPAGSKSNSQTISQVSILVGAQARCGLVPSAIWSVC